MIGQRHSPCGRRHTPLGALASFHAFVVQKPEFVLPHPSSLCYTRAG